MTEINRIVMGRTCCMSGGEEKWTSAEFWLYCVLWN